MTYLLELKSARISNYFLGNGRVTLSKLRFVRGISDMRNQASGLHQSHTTGVRLADLLKC